MIDFLDDFPAMLLRTTLLLTLAAFVVRGLIWAARPYSPSIHRFAWGLVLAQGLVVASWSLNIPWYEPTRSTAVPVARSTEQLPDFSVLTAGEESVPSAEPIAAIVSQPIAPSQSSWTLGRILTVCWLGGMTLMIGVTFGSYSLLLRALYRARAPRSKWYREWTGLLAEYRIGRKIPLLVHEKLGPMLCRLPNGYCVVVPEDLWTDLSADQRVAILRHELAHYQRRDIWKSLAARILALPHWFNPAAWWAVRKFDEGAEWACDQHLAANRPRQIPGFARALLEIVEPKSRNVCVSAASGGSLSVRLRRLLSFQDPEDSRMKKLLLFFALFCLAAVGVFRIQLVAKDDDPTEAEATVVGDDMEKRIADFSSRLSNDDRSLLGRLRETLQTPAGRIVMQDRAAHFEQMLREKAESAALPGFIDAHFEKTGEKYRLRSDQDDFRSQILKASSVFDEDISRMTPALREIAGNLATDTDTERLVARFLKHDAAATLLYVEGLRETLRPGEAQVRQRLGELFVANQQGEYFIRESYRDEAEEILEKSRRMLKSVPLLRVELPNWADEMAETDDLHKQFKQAMTEPAFATMIAVHFLDNGAENADQSVDEFFENLENITEDTGDGLVIVKNQTAEVKELMQNYGRLRVAAEKLKAPVSSFAKKIRAGKPLEDGWRTFLKSEVGQFRLADEIGFGTDDPAEAVRMMLSEVITKSADGKYRVRPERSDEVTEYMRNLFRANRQVRRQLRVIDRLAATLEDQELKTAFTSLSGKFIVAQILEKSMAQHQHDGLTAWIDDHFEQSDKKLVLREGAQEAIQAILKEAEELTKELEKDDF